MYQGQIDGKNFQANVEIVEHLGSEELVHFASSNFVFEAKYDPSIVLNIGDTNKEVIFNLKNSHVFDSETEMTIV